ncbi:MAG: hypothetical protein PHT19_06180 [Methylococcus sp.]|nr:hypothetical protein [Methylococcus sp.]
MALRHNPAIVPQAVLFGIGGLLVALMQALDGLGTRQSYAVLTLLLLYFLWLQVMSIRRLHPQLWLLNPVFQCTFQTFTMGYGITNVLFFLPPETIAFAGLVPDVFPAMVAHQYLALLGAIMLYLGYWSPLASRLTSPRSVARFQQAYLPRLDLLRAWTIPMLMGIAGAARLFAIRLALYGYGGNYGAEHLAETGAGAFMQYLALAGGLGKLALLLAGLGYFSPGGGARDLLWFWGAMVSELFFGLLSGFKTSVVMPFVIVGVCQYLRQGRIPINWILTACLALIVAYAVIQPFRFAHKERGGSLTSVSDIISLMQQSAMGDSSAVPQHDGPDSTLVSVAARANLSYIGAFGLEYADTHRTLPSGSPEFLEDIFLAPIHALVPRFIWDSKPLGTFGLWYNQVVMGMGHFSSTAMGTLAYLYFAGGYPAVVIAYYFFGMLQRVLWFRLTPWQSMPGAVVMLGLLALIASPENSVDGIIIGLLRQGFLLTLLTHLLFQRRRRQPARSSAYTPAKSE